MRGSYHDSEMIKVITGARQDFSKHAEIKLISRLNLVRDSIPMQLAKENKKYIYGQVREGARAKDFELAIQWLLDCGLIHKVARVSKPALPLKAYMDLDSFKMFLLDIGLLIAMTDLDARVIIDGNRIFTEFKGRNDFLVQGKTFVIPIEVKAGDNMNCEDMTKIPQLNNVLNLKAGAAGMKNTIRWIYFADCLQCVRNEYHVEDYIHGGEFVVLTNPDVTEDKNKLMALITSMVDYGIAALGINEGQILPELIEYCDSENLPLFELPEKFPLVDLSQILCKRLVLEENNRNLEEQVFASILDAEHLNRDSVLEQAQFLGIDLSGSFCVIEFTFSRKRRGSKDLLSTGQEIRSIINMEFSFYQGVSVLVMPQTGSVLALVSTDRLREEDLKTVLNSIVTNADKKYHINLKVGIGSSVEYLEDVKTSRQEAAEAVRVASISDTEEHIFFYKNQGIYTFISKVTDSRFLDDYVGRNIGKLIDTDEINNGNLCETLESYLNHNCNVKETAQSLIIHRNTLNYRLNRIRELLGVDFENLDTCLGLKLAFMIRNYRGKSR